MAEGRELRTVESQEQTETELGAGRPGMLDASDRLLSSRRSRTATEPWWAASLEAVRESEGPKIPLPPQITEERVRHEAARAAAEKAEALRKAMTQRDEERRRVVTRSVNVSVTCDRCGTLCNDRPGESFSFCPECGADLPNRVHPMTSASAQTAAQQRTQSQSAAAPHRQTVSATATASVGGYRRTAATVTTAPPRSLVAPGVAAFCSFLLPGTGQLLNGQPEKGILLLLGMYIAAFLFAWPLIGLPLLAIRILVTIDAYRIAERKRRGGPVRSGEWDIS